MNRFFADGEQQNGATRYIARDHLASVREVIVGGLVGGIIGGVIADEIWAAIQQGNNSDPGVAELPPRRQATISR